MKKFVIIVLVLLFLCPAATAKKVGDVEVPNSITLDGKNLVLNGAGMRVKKVVFVKIDVYAAGLYLESTSADARAIIDADTPMAIRMYMTTGMASKEKLRDAWTEGFENATGGKTVSIKEEIAKFNALFKVDPEEGDIYEIAYLPGKGISVSLNGELQGATIPGMDFKKAVFGIWLAKDIDDKYLKELKSDLLGQ